MDSDNRVLIFRERMDDFFDGVTEVTVSPKEWEELELATKRYSFKQLERELHRKRGNKQSIVTDFYTD